MEVYAYDNRVHVPSHVNTFLRINSRYAKINLITNAGLTGVTNNNVNLIEIKTLSKLDKICSLFDRLYVHRSSNPAEFEKLCFYRWFAYDQASKHLRDSDYLCILDTDQAIFVDPCKILQLSSSRDHVPELVTWLPAHRSSPVIEAGPALTLITKRCLHRFCIFLLDQFYSATNDGTLNRLYYESLTSDHGESISDMTALGMFARTKVNEPFSLREFSDPRGNHLFCENFLYFFTSHYQGHVDPLLFGGSFEYDDYMLFFRSSISHCRVIGLHFQGASKALMELFDQPTTILQVSDFDAYLQHYSSLSNQSQTVAKATNVHNHPIHIVKNIYRRLTRHLNEEI